MPDLLRQGLSGLPENRKGDLDISGIPKKDIEGDLAGAITVTAPLGNRATSGIGRDKHKHLQNASAAVILDVRAPHLRRSRRPARLPARFSAPT